MTLWYNIIYIYISIYIILYILQYVIYITVYFKYYSILYIIMIVYIRMFFSTFDNSTTGFDSLPSQGILVVCGRRASALVALGPVLAEDAILWQELFYGINFIELDYGKIYRKAPYLMGKSMVSCIFSLKPIHLITINRIWQKEENKPPPKKKTMKWPKVTQALQEPLASGTWNAQWNRSESELIQTHSNTILTSLRTIRADSS